MLCSFNIGPDTGVWHTTLFFPLFYFFIFAKQNTNALLAFILQSIHVAFHLYTRTINLHFTCIIDNFWVIFMVVGTHEAARRYCVGWSKFLIVCAPGWLEEHVGPKMSTGVFIYVSAVCIKAGNWWRTDYVYYDTIPYLCKFTALIYMHLLFRKYYMVKLCVKS